MVAAAASIGTKRRYVDAGRELNPTRKCLDSIDGDATIVEPGFILKPSAIDPKGIP